MEHSKTAETRIIYLFSKVVSRRYHNGHSYSSYIPLILPLLVGCPKVYKIRYLYKLYLAEMALIYIYPRYNNHCEN